MCLTIPRRQRSENSNSVGMSPVNKTPISWFGLLVLVSLVSVAAAPAEGAGRAQAKSKASSSSSSTTNSKGTRAKPSTAYSAARARARRAALARARARAMARETANTKLPRYKVDEMGALVPDLHAEAAVIYDPETNQVLWEQNSQTQRSIASITKVMTATVFLENNPDLSEMVTIARSDVFRASTTHLRANDQVTTDDLLHLMLIASDNAAARALARVSPYGSEGFVRRMNEKATELGLEMTSYADPSGLLSDNVSSAYDMALLITLASNDERIASIMRTPDTRCTPSSAGRLPSVQRIICSACQTSTCARPRPVSFPSRVIAWRLCCRYRRVASRWRWSFWAHGRMPDDSSRRAISCSGSRRRPPRCWVLLCRQGRPSWPRFPSYPT